MYALNGSDLVLEEMGSYTNPHRQNNIVRTGERQFYQRKEGSYQKIIRHGATPATYWWEVIDRLGNKTFYGGFSGVDNNAVIKDANGNIAYWAITRMEDPYQNYIQYFYIKETKAIAGSAVTGQKFNIDKIQYTKHASIGSYYEINFKRNVYTTTLEGETNTTINRKDVIVNGRNGILQLTDDVLTEIHVSQFIANQLQPIRSYRFDYQEMDFQKQQIKRISEFDPKGKLFYSNTMEYYTMGQNQQIIGDGLPWSAGGNDVLNSPLPPIQDVTVNGSALGTSTAQGYSFGFRAGFGYGADVMKVNRSIGGSFNYSKNTQKTAISFIDINGDGLPDKVVSNGLSVFYRPNTGQGFGDIIPIGSINELSKTKSRTVGAGADASFGILSIGKSWNKTKSETDGYFTDMNGDGLVDFISGGTVKFNVMGGTGNIQDRSFVTNVASSENYIAPGTILPEIINTMKFDSMNELREQNPQFDHVKVWEAPFDGVVTIQGTATLLEKNVDGNSNHLNEFKITIEGASNNQTTGPTTTIFAPTTLLKAKGEKISHNIKDVVIKKGEKIFFRIHNVETGYGGKIEWNPKITYASITKLPVADLNAYDENGNQHSQYDSQTDFILNNDEGADIPYGDTSITINFNLLSAQYPALAFSDDIKFHIKLYKLNATTGELELVTAWSREYDQLTAGIPTANNPTYSLLSGTRYSLKVYTESASNVKWNAINWKPTYTGNNSGAHDLPVNHNNYDDNLNQSKYWIYGSSLPTPVINTSVPNDGNQAMMVFSHTLLDEDFTSLTASLPVGTVLQANWVIKKQNSTATQTEVLHKRNIYIIKTLSGYVLSKTDNAASPVPILTDPNYVQYILTKNMVKDIKNSGSNLFAAFYVSTKEINFNRNITLDIHATQTSNYSFSAVLTKPFISKTTGLLGSSYRAWNQFLYNGGLQFQHDSEGNILNSNNPINLGLAAIDMGIFNMTSQKGKLDELQNKPAEEINVSDAPVRYVTYKQDKKNNKYTNEAIIGANYGVNKDASVTVTVGRFGEASLWDIYMDPTDITSSLGAGIIRGIKQRSQSKGTSISGGASFASGTASSATSEVLNQYIDLNGDRYPDLITGGRIQYTNMLGGLSSKIEMNAFTSGDTSKDFTFGATIPCLQPHSTDTGNGKTTGNKTNTNISSGINTSNGESFNFTQWADINGDGLPDKVKITDATVVVALNTGYGFTPEINWFTGSELYKSSLRFNGSIGVTFGFGNSFAMGMGAAISTANMTTMLVDVNGDGLPDLLTKNGNTEIYHYRLNNGSGFTDSATLFYNGLVEKDDSISSNAFGAYTFGFPIIILGFTLKVVFTPSIGVNNTFSQKKISLQDINGDGLVDVIEKGNSDTNNGSIDARLNTVGKTHLLKKVNTPLGGSWAIDYIKDGNTYKMPQSKWTLDKIVTHDGFVDDKAYKLDSTLTRVTYNNPKHDRRERDFFGYEQVVIRQQHPDTGNTFRVTAKSYHTENYYLNGAEKASAVYNDIGQLLSEEKTFFNLLDPDVPIVNMNANATGSFLQANKEYNAKALIDQSRLLVAVAKITATNYEGNEALTTVKEFTNYNNKGNITTFVDYGTGADDAYKTVIDYYNLVSGVANGVGFPKKILVYKRSSGELYRERTAIYNNKGKLSQIITKLNLTEENNVSFGYDNYGNLTTINNLDNLNASGAHYVKNIDYDLVVKTYPVHFTNSFGESSTTEYNYHFGIPIFTTDANGKSMRTRIDDRGRVVEVTGPNELALETLNGNSSGWTIRTEYKGENAITGSLPTNNNYYILPAIGKFEAVAPGTAQPLHSQHYAVTRHFDEEYANLNSTTSTNQLLTISIVDGFGQPVQVKKTLKSDALKWQVTGFEEKDAFGRVLKSYLPTVQNEYPNDLSALGNATNYWNVAPAALPVPVEMTYDNKDRMVSVKQPGENQAAQITYAIENAMFVKKVTNELGQKNNSYTDSRGRQRKTVQNDVLTTTFEYNAINELTRIIDNNGFSTGYRYDLAGRKTEMQHPDRGVITFKYDKAGRMVEQSNSNLLLSGGLKVNYSYDFGRLVKITYPQNPLNEVKYTYGAPTDAFAADQNAIGRLLYQEDATGVQVFGYGQMGEITKNLRSVAVAGYQSYWFFTTWKYDSWNRIHKITYPDQEIVSYRYNKGGALEAMSRSFASGNDNLSIVDSITYNDYGERTAILYGNGTRTSYSYDTRRRMNALTHNFTNFQITKNYGYDVLSNITSITTDQPQNSLPVANQIGGPVNHTYQYDEFNRIIHATGNYTGYDDLNTAHLVQNYELNMEYNLDHTIKKKTQIQTRGLANVYGSPPVNTVPVYKNSYILDYTDYAKGAFATGSGYGYQQPHAPRTITESPSWVNGLTTEDPRIRKKEVSYDANGNQTEIKEKVGELKTSLRKNLWDEENRLMAVNLKPDDVNNHPIAVYTYSGSERVVRYNFDILTAYSNGTKIGEGSKDNIMIYPSGFITGKVYHSSDQTKINRMTYTRHYYIGSQRIGSSTGNTKANDMGWYPRDLITTHMSGFNSTETRTASNTTVTDAGTTINTIYTKFGLTPPPLDPIVENTMANYSYDPDNIDAYYFHPDHLGSSSYISNAGGTVSQHMEYLPFGETLVDEHINSISSPFKFNGKEKDEETGNYYYGARYYDPKLSMFISVDPLAEKTGDAYGYCYQNPIRFTDPTGMSASEGDFINEKGVVVGSDGIKDGKLYLIKTTKGDFDSRIEVRPAGISIIEAEDTEAFIKENNGKKDAFKGNNIAYKNSIEIEGNIKTRQAMVDEVNRDDGTGGTSESNNREFGGYINKDGTIRSATPGAPGLPTDGKSITMRRDANTKTMFHSHPSGSDGTNRYRQGPSIDDIRSARDGNRTEYVFGRGNGIITIYDGTGVLATIPQENFVNPIRN
ncbi:MAG TPA: RHS repeat-associated core domain-containing protein [Flavobacterium sp.]|nr:RHS repeat-associated core domain-containing protein [Flavobacterium sp.]